MFVGCRQVWNIDPTLVVGTLSTSHSAKYVVYIYIPIKIEEYRSMCLKTKYLPIIDLKVSVYVLIPRKE